MEDNEVVIIEQQDQSMEEKSSLTPGQMFSFQVKVMEQLQWFHLRTKLKSEHETLGMFYEEATDLFDDLFEILTTHFGDFPYEPVDYQIVEYGEITSSEVLAELYEELSLCDCQGIDDIKKIKDDIMALISKTLFLLRLQ